MHLFTSQGRLGRLAISVSCTRATGIQYSDKEKGNPIPFLFVVTFFLATASCSSIRFSRCFSRFCSISSCSRSLRIASLGASFRFWAAEPPNHDHILISDFMGYVVVSLRRQFLKMYSDNQGIHYPSPYGPRRSGLEIGRKLWSQAGKINRQKERGAALVESGRCCRLSRNAISGTIDLRQTTNRSKGMFA